MASGNRAKQGIAAGPHPQDHLAQHTSGIGGFGAKMAAPTLSAAQIAKCREWAEEGVEYAKFTGNDVQNFEKDEQDTRVRKEVEMVMFAMADWTMMPYTPGMPKVTEAEGDMLELEGDMLEFEEVEMRPPIYNPGIKLGKEADIDDLPGSELDLFQFPDIPFEFKLKDECD